MSSSTPDEVFAAAGVWARPRQESDASPPSPKSEDEALMIRVQAGDESALGQLLELHSRLVLGIGYRILRDTGEAQELVQDVFLHAYRKCQLFDPQRGSFRGWRRLWIFRRDNIPGLVLRLQRIEWRCRAVWRRLTAWLKNSPGFNLDKVRTPVRLVALGKSSVLGDLWEWYAGLSLQRKPVDFVVIPDASHIYGKSSERMLKQQGLVDWFSFWLKDEEDPNPAKVDQYVRWRELRRLEVQRKNVEGPQ